MFCASPAFVLGLHIYCTAPRSIAATKLTLVIDVETDHGFNPQPSRSETNSEEAVVVHSTRKAAAETAKAEVEAAEAEAEVILDPIGSLSPQGKKVDG